MVINYLMLFLGLGIASMGLYYGLLRPGRGFNFRARNQCYNQARYGMDVTYQDNCPTNRSTYRTYYAPSTQRFSTGGGLASPRRNSSTVRSFRGGGPGAGK